MSKLKGFYSAVDEAAQALKRGKGTGKEFMTELIKVKGVKPTEIKERGLQKIEAMPKITKEEFLKELKRRPAPQVEEKVLREPTRKELEAKANELAYDDAFQELRDEGMNRHEAVDVAAEMADERADDYLDQAAEALSEEGDVPYHGNYVIPGGENYREILLKMPGFKGDKKIMELEAMRRRVDPKLHSHRYEELTKQIDELKAEKAGTPEPFQGVGAHFGGEPGVLASIRVSDRTGPKGEEVLHVEEIQSDWHQQGRKKGYAGDFESEAEMLKKRDDLYDARTDLVKQAIAVEQQGGVAPQELIDRIHKMNDDLRLIEERKDKARNAVPDAPFKKNWHELAMKRMINYAAENGYDKIAITPGAEQANRYNLAKQVEAIRVNLNPDGTYQLGVQPIGRNMQRHETSVPADKLADMIGKDLAEKVTSEVTKTGVDNGKVFSGLDLEVGGEGMKGFYDKMLPDYLNAYGKKHGVKVTPMDISAIGEEKPMVSVFGDGSHRVEHRGETQDFPTEEEANAYISKISKAPVHSFDITPEMREEITGKGLPLYQQIGIPAGGAAAGAEALEQEEPGFAAGGPVMAAKGGEFDTEPDMADGGARIQGGAFKKGGRVKVSDNPDTMWLELVSKN